MNVVWNEIQSSLRDSLGTQNYEIWIRPIQLASATEAEVHLQVPNRYYRDWVQANYAAKLREALGAAAGHPVDVQFQVAGRAAPAAPSPELPQAVSNDPTGPRIVPGLAPDKTFDNFVVGACNQFAHAAALAVAEAPGESQYNPLFIYGSTGLGKTHLMQAVGNRIRTRFPERNLLYVTAEQFTNELIDALRYRRMPDFRDKYRKYPGVLLMDDVQFLTGKDRTQEELFHTFEWLKERGRQIVFSADVLPREIKMFEPRLRTRCESGMLADTQPPDLETLVAIMRQKAEDLQIVLPEELAQYIAARVRGSVRELEGVLHRLKALSRLFKQTPSIDFARQHLGSVLVDETRAPSAEEIIQTVADFYNIKVSDLKGSRRLKRIVRPRHVAMWLVRDQTELSFPEMGRVFGRDHATVQHACKKIRTELQRDADLRSAVETIERNLRS